MNDDYVTKKDLEVFGERLEQKMEQNFDQKLEEKLEEKLAPIKHEINKIRVMDEVRDKKLDSIIEMLAPNLEKTTDHEDRISSNEDLLNQHDVQIKSLIK